MNRIPTEGLKPSFANIVGGSQSSLNEQNPDRGIETPSKGRRDSCAELSLNEQNPDRGIETEPILRPLDIECELE